MYIMNCICVISGEQLSPEALNQYLHPDERVAFYPFGEVAVRVDYPLASIVVSGEFERIFEIASQIEVNEKQNMKCTSILLNVVYKNQCNMEFRPNELKHIADINLPLRFICRLDDDAEYEWPPEYS